MEKSEYTVIIETFVSMYTIIIFFGLCKPVKIIITTVAWHLMGETKIPKLILPRLVVKTAPIINESEDSVLGHSFHSRALPPRKELVFEDSYASLRDIVKGVCQALFRDLEAFVEVLSSISNILMSSLS